MKRGQRQTQTAIITKSGEGTEADFKSYYTIYLKCPECNKNYEAFKERRQYEPYTGKK